MAQINSVNDMFLSAGATSLGTLGSSVAQIPAEMLMSHIQKGNQIDIMNHQNALNRSNFTLQNAQNSPSAQVARFRAAGLNPALIYSGNGASGMSSSISGATSAGVGRGQPSSAVISPQEITQMRNIDADTNKKNEETIALKTENLYAEDKILLDLANRRMDYVVKLSQAKKNSAEADAALKSIAQIDALIQESQERKNKLTEEIKLVKAETELTQHKAGREKNKLDYENKSVDDKGRKVPFEMRLSPSGIVSDGMSNLKTSVGRAVDKVKNAVTGGSQEIPVSDKSFGELSKKEKAQLSRLKSGWQSLKKYDAYKHGSRKQYEKIKEDYRKKIISLGYSKFIL